jgi:dephospho-CoA kinase
MLRVGLTGDLGSGKSTVARMFVERGAIILSSDEMARAMMQPGQPVYTEIVRLFGPPVVGVDGALDRRRLAELAFDRAQPRVEALNAIVHPAVLEAQAEQIAAIARSQPDAVVVVESALIFATKHAPEGQWRSRFDRIVLVAAPEAQKIARFIERTAAGREFSSAERSTLIADARARLALQHTELHAADCLVLHNDGDIEQLEDRVEAVWRELKAVETAR